jgi:hypothetical protein
MSTILAREPSSKHELDESLAQLRDGSASLLQMSIAKRLELINRCIDGVGEVARDWVSDACEAKGIAPDGPASSEEITGGPIATIRFLRLLAQTLQDVAETGRPKLPGKVTQQHGQCRVPVFPTPLMFDSITFRPMTAETWLLPGVDPNDVTAHSVAKLCGEGLEPEVSVVLGAGNVASIAATDALTKILIDNQAVSMKMNPVNEYLGPHFEKALRPLIDADLLRIAYGGVETGSHLIQHDSVAGVHITGSTFSHDAIVWGTDGQQQQRRAENQPLLRKNITSELGNVTPWAIVPSQYSDKELRSQAETFAASITNNVSFNCVATKMIITARSWSQREKFFAILDQVLARTPRRKAYYPGAADRFERFSGRQPEDRERLPWTILRDIDPQQSPHLVKEESFTCVSAELCIDADSEVDFLRKVTDVMNEETWGTLAASLTVPKSVEQKHAQELDECLRNLRFGTIAINQWSGISFALMSPPWGGHPSSTLQDVKSGIGFVHNTYLLDQPEKTVLRAPLVMSPKPVWFSTHKHPQKVAWNLLELCQRPSLTKLPSLLLSAITG